MQKQAGPGALMGDTQAFVNWLSENDPKNTELVQGLDTSSWAALLKSMLGSYGDADYVVQLISQYETDAGINPAAAAGKKKAKHKTLVSVASKLLAKGWNEKQIKAHLLKKAGSIGNVIYNVQHIGDGANEVVKISFQISESFRAGLTPDDTDERVQAFASQLDNDFYKAFEDLM